MTVVSPSLTSTCVSARCVSIGGIPLTDRLKSERILYGDAYDHRVGRRDLRWTSSVSAASRNVTVTVLLATVWINLDTLGNLRFDVVLRRDAALRGCGPGPTFREPRARRRDSPRR